MVNAFVNQVSADLIAKMVFIELKIYLNKCFSLFRGFSFFFLFLQIVFLFVIHFFLEIDNCLSNTCLNGGTCVNGLNGPECICTDQWQGKGCSFG